MKKNLILVTLLIVILIGSYSVFVLFDKMQPSCAEVGHSWQNSALISDRYSGGSSLSTALLELFSIMRKNDKKAFVDIFPQQTTFIKETHLTRYSAKKQQQRYENAKEYYQTSWDRVMLAAQPYKIEWENIELLGYSGTRQKNSASQRLMIRDNGKNYFIPVKLKRVDKNSAWDIMYLGKLRLYELKNKKLSDVEPLHKQYDFGQAPDTGFSVTYFDLKTGKPACKENIDEINVYLYDKKKFTSGGTFCGVSVRNLGAYFIGNLDFSDEQEKLIAINVTHWAKAQLDIDGQPVLSNKNSSIKYKFTAGRHKVEALYQPHLNDIIWSEFSLNMTTPRTLYSRKELQQKLHQLDTKNSLLWYASVHESKKSNDGTISLELQPSSKPVILIISTINGRKFAVKNIQQANLQAIIFTGEAVADIKTDGATNVPVYHLLWAHGIAYMSEFTTSADDYDKEENERYKQALINSIDRLFPNKALSGIATAYSADTLTVPQILLSPREYRSLKKQYCIIPIL